MAKYDDLCLAFSRSRSEAIAYRQRSEGFLVCLLEGFEEYLGAPSERVQFLPPDADASNPGTMYSSLGAVQLGDDGWWIACLRLTLSVGPGVFPEAPLLFQFRVFAESSRFIVRLGTSHQTHAIPAQFEPDALIPIYDEAYTLATEYFTHGIERFLDEAAKSTKPRKIGFDVPKTA